MRIYGKRAICTLLAVLLCLSMMTGIVFPASAAQAAKIENVKVTAENLTEYQSYYATNLVDGNKTNFWHSASGKTSAYITFDLGVDTDVEKLVYYARSGNLDRGIKDYEIWLSDAPPAYTKDGVAPAGLAATPTTVGELDQCTTSDLTKTITMPSGAYGRFLTLHIKSIFDTAVYITICELEIYGTPHTISASTKIENVSVNTNVAYYNTSYGVYPPEMMVDGIVGNNSNFWEGKSTTAYVTLDLGVTARLDKMLVFARTNTDALALRNIKEYELWVSDTAPIYQGTNGQAPAGLAQTPTDKGTMAQTSIASPCGTIAFPEDSVGRYVTIHIVSIYGTSAIDIQEIEVYGEVVTQGLIESKIKGIKVVAENAKEYKEAATPYPATMLVDGVDVTVDSSMWHGLKGVTEAYITFDLGASKNLSKMLVYGRPPSLLRRNIKNYEIWVSDTAPVYSGVDGETPTGLAATPTAKGEMNECTADVPYGTIKLPVQSKGRFVTLHIVDLYDMSNSFNIREIEFFERLTDVEAAAATVSELQVDYETEKIVLPEIEGYTIRILSSSNENIVTLDGSVNTVNGGTAKVVLQLEDVSGNTAATEAIEVFVLGLSQKMAAAQAVKDVSVSSALVGRPGTIMIAGYAKQDGTYGKWWSSAQNVKENEIIVTLTEAQDVTGVSLLPGNNASYFPDSIAVYTSKDNETWTPVFAEEGIQITDTAKAYPYYFDVQKDVGYVKINTVNAEAYTQLGKIEALIAPEFETAAAAAEKLSVIQNDQAVVIDDISAQFGAAILEASDAAVVSKDGSITLPSEVTDVTLSIKVTNLLDKNDTAVISRTLRVKTQGILDVEAVAQATDLLPCPDKEATKIPLPEVPEGYSVKLVESDRPDIVDINGNITRSDTETIGVRLTLEITNDATGLSANTKALLVPIYKTYVAPTVTQAEIEKIHQDYESKSYGVFVHYIAEYNQVSATLYRDGRVVVDVDELANAFDVKQFAKDMHDFGAEYVVFTVQHGDDAPLFPSITNQRWRDDRRSKDSTDRKSYSDRDVIDELLDALDQYGIDLHLYTRFGGLIHMTSAEDKENFENSESSDQFYAFNLERTYELVERYGTRIKGLWFDGMGGSYTVGEERESVRQMLLTFNPALIIAINTGFKEGQVNLYSHYNFQDASAWEVNRWVSYRELAISRHQVASCLASQYWWTRFTQDYTFDKQPLSEMFQYIVSLSSISYEGGFLASTGIYAIEPEEHGKENDLWMNGMRDYLVELNTDYMTSVSEAVRNTSVAVAYPTKEGSTINEMEWGVSTESRDGKNVYLHVFNAPEGNALTLPKAADGSVFAESAQILNFDGTVTEGVTVTKTEDGYTVTLPEGKTWDSVDTIIKAERVGYDESIPEYTGEKVFYDQDVEGFADGTKIVREYEGKEYYFTVGENVSGVLTDDCYPEIDGVKQVYFFAKEYQPFHVYFGSYALYGAKAGINPNDENDITKSNALRASDAGETVLVGVDNATPKGTTYIGSEGTVTLDGFTLKGNAQLYLGAESRVEATKKTNRVKIENCRNSTAEDAYTLAPAKALIYGNTVEHKIVNIKNNRFDGVCFDGTSATSLIMLRNWEGVVENNFFGMKDSLTIENGAAFAGTIFWLQGETLNVKDWEGKTDVTIRGNWLEGRVSTTVNPMWHDEYKVHILDNTIVPTAASKSMINISVGGSADIDGITKYYSGIDTADILIKGNRVVDVYGCTGVGLIYFTGTITADAAEQVAAVNNYKAGSIKVIQNEIAHNGNYAFGGKAAGIAGYDNLKIDIACNKYGDTVAALTSSAMDAFYADLGDETAHKDVQVIADTPATSTAAGVGHKECAFCGKVFEGEVTIPATGEAMIGERIFATFEEALSVAQAGDTVRLMQNASVDKLILNDTFTLDLGGKVLTADYVVGFKGSAIGGEGKLIVDKNKVALDRTNGGYLPVYEDGGYIFVNVNLENRTAVIAEKKFAFSPVFDTEAHEALLAGYAASGVQIVIRLQWEKANNYEAVQDFTYVDEMVKAVIGSYDAANANYGSMFIAEFAGSEAGDADSVSVSAVIISDTGVEIQSAVTEF